MATTGTQIFEITMGLIDALSKGAYDTAENADYKSRLVSIINSVTAELYPYSSMGTASAGARPTPVFIGALSDIVDLDDALARGVLPHGAAAQLLINEAAPTADYHEQKYCEKLAVLKNTPQVTENIDDVYGIYSSMSCDATS